MIVMPNATRSFQGESESFNCSALGGPGNMFSWMRLHDSMMVGNMSSLTVSVSSATDGGQYRCDVTNLAGNDFDTVTLNGELLYIHCLHGDLSFAYQQLNQLLLVNYLL